MLSTTSHHQERREEAPPLRTQGTLTAVPPQWEDKHEGSQGCGLSPSGASEHLLGFCHLALPDPCGSFNRQPTVSPCTWGARRRVAIGMRATLPRPLQGTLLPTCGESRR